MFDIDYVGLREPANAMGESTMSREQKIAWLVVGMFLITIVAFVVLMLTVGRFAWGAFGLFGLVGFGPLIFRKKPKDDVVATDERVRMIAHKATLGGAMMSYGIFILTCMTTWSIYHAQGQKIISIHVLPLIVFAGGISFYISRSIALLILYDRESAHGED